MTKINDLMRLPENMRSKIELAHGPRGTCWQWIGCVNSRGYGCVSVDGKVQLTHRVSYEIHTGPIPDGLQIDHLCRNKKCCNPSHLEAVTQKVNCERTDQATKERCVHGHPLAGTNLRVKPVAGGLTKRQCRVCEIDRGARAVAEQSKGLRKPSASVAARRAAKRAAYIANGESALAAAMGAAS